MAACLHWSWKVKESESYSVVSNSLWPHGLYSTWNSLGQNTGVGSLSHPQGFFPAQGSNPGLLPCRQIRYQLSHKGSSGAAYPFSSGSSRPTNQTGISCIAGRFFTSWAIREHLTSNLMHPLSDSFRFVQPYEWFPIIHGSFIFPTNCCWPSLVSSIFQDFLDVLTIATVLSVLIIFYLDFCSSILAFLLLGFLCSSQCFSDCPSKSDFPLPGIWQSWECIVWKKKHQMMLVNAPG